MWTSKRSGRTRRAVGALVTVSLLAGWTGMTARAQSQTPAELRGALLDPSGQAAVGFRAIVLDVKTGTEYTSPPTNARGEYILNVHVGSRYQIVAVVSAEGERLSVQQTWPMPIRVPGTYQLPDVQFVHVLPEVKQEEAQPEETVPPSSPQEPWYKKRGGVIGIVLGVVVIVVAVATADDHASPSTP